jgi:hypothetical protein
MTGHVEMRPKLAWRLVLPAIAVASVVVATSIWVRLVFLVVLGGSAIAAWVDIVRVDAGEVDERGLLGWRRPLDLNDVVEVEFKYRIGFKDYPHRELWLETPDDHVWIISLRWWSHWRPFVAEVVQALSSAPTDGSYSRVWHVKADRATRSRLEDFLAEAAGR